MLGMGLGWGIENGKWEWWVGSFQLRFGIGAALGMHHGVTEMVDGESLEHDLHFRSKPPHS